jgi:hypothetical protein
MAGLYIEEHATQMIDGSYISLISIGANLAAATLALTLGLLLIPALLLDSAGAPRLRNP